MNVESVEFKQLVSLVTKKITLKQYFNDYVTKIKSGVNTITEGVTSSICPFHDETKPSFSYWHSTDTCYCFGCGVGGGLLQIYRRVVYDTQHRSITNDIAVIELINLYNLQTDTEIIALLEQCKYAETVKRNKFAEYRTKAFAENRISVDLDVMTLAKYKYLNTHLLEDKHITEQARFRNYALLDLQAAVALDLVKHK